MSPVVFFALTSTVIRLSYNAIKIIIPDEDGNWLLDSCSQAVLYIAILVALGLSSAVTDQVRTSGQQARLGLPKRHFCPENSSAEVSPARYLYLRPRRYRWRNCVTLSVTKTLLMGL